MFSGQSIGRRLILMVATINILVLAMVTVIAVNSNTSLLQREAMERFATENIQASQALDSQLQSVKDATENLVDRIQQLDTLSAQELGIAIRDAIEEDDDILIHRVAVFRPADPDDNESTDSVVVFQIPDPLSGSIQERRVYTQVMDIPEDARIFQPIDSGEAIWFYQDNAFYDPSQQLAALSFSMSYQVPDTGEIGVLWVDIPSDVFNELLVSTLGSEGILSESTGGYTILVDKEDNPIIHEGLGDDISLEVFREFAEYMMYDLNPQTETFGLYPLSDPVSDEAVLVAEGSIPINGWQLISVLPEVELPEPSDELVTQIVVISILGLVTLVAVVYRFAQKVIVTPLLSIRQAAQEIGTGDLRYYIDFQERRDEVGWLARAMDDMKRHLAYSHDELSRWAQTLERRVSQRTEEVQQAQKQAEIIANELRAVYDSSLQVVNEPLLQPILDSFVERILTLLQVNYCSVWLLTSKKTHLQLAANSLEALTAQSIVIPKGQGMIGQVVQTMQPLIVADYRQYERHIYLPDETEAPYHHAMCVPLSIAGRPIGGVLVGRQEDALPFDEGAQRLLALFANMVSPAVRNAQLLVQRNTALNEAERANQVKTRFLASVTHELRTPLNLVINNMDFMRVGAFGEVTEEQGTRLNQTVRSAEMLLYLINDLLDISKIEAGEMQFLFQPTDVTVLIEDALDDANALLEKIEGKSGMVQVVSDIEPDLPIIRLDTRRIRQILNNLLSNAIKFTDAGEVKLQVSKVEDGIQFIVTDTGIGVPESEMPILFEAFERTTAAKEQHIEGTGLGLPISRFLVQQHGGDITVQSEPGKGSTFSFILPFTMPVQDGDGAEAKNKVDTQLMKVLGTKS